MSIFRALALSREPAAAMMSVGVLWGGFAALVPDIKVVVGASDAQLGAALLMSAAGGMIAMLLAPRFGRAVGHHALPLSGAAVCLAFLFPSWASSVVGLGLAMFGIGITVAQLDITANVMVSARESRAKLHLMNVNHAMFSVAFAITAYCVGLARQAGYGPSDVLPVLAVVNAGLVVFMWSAAPDVVPPEDETEAPRRVPWVAIGLTGLILFAAFVGENATEAWSALHIERTLGAPAGEGSFGPATLGVVMAIGRFSGQVLAEKLGHGRLIFWSGALGVTGALIIAGAPTPSVAVMGVAVTALGLAVIVPSANSMLGAHVTERQRSHALSRAWMLGIMGFFIGPAMMGGISELFGLHMSFVAISFLVALVLPAVWMLEHRAKPV